MQIIALFLGLIMLLSPVTAPAEETPAPKGDQTAEAEQMSAENVSLQCNVKSAMKSFNRKYLRDNNFDTKNYVSAKSPLYVELNDCGAKYLCIGWETSEAPRIVRFYGAEDVLLSEVTELYPYHDEVLCIPENTVRLEILAAGEEKIALVEAQLYTEGVLPEPWGYTWEPTPDHLDFLVISTHFDDDVLFLGGAMPIYGMERGYTGTILYMTYQQRLRLDEALRGAWTMGTRCYPLFAMLPDVYKADNKRAVEFSEAIVTKTLVRFFRQYKPLVIFTQDTEGEYGHWQHIQTVKCALSAIALAADASYDTESAEAYGTWQVQKAYTHLYPENKLILDTRAPLSAFGGLNAFEIATEAYTKHVSQHQYWFYVSDENQYSIGDYGMSFCAVENPGEDVFDGIDETLWAGYVPPTPTPTPEPTPTPTSTPEPTPTPTNTPAPTEAPTDTPIPEETPDVGQVLQIENDEIQWVILCGIGLVLIILFMYVLVLVNRHKKALRSQKRKKKKKRK